MVRTSQQACSGGVLLNAVHFAVGFFGLREGGIAIVPDTWPGIQHQVHHILIHTSTGNGFHLGNMKSYRIGHSLADVTCVT